jgi:small subunit ribosomal protein S20e
MQKTSVKSSQNLSNLLFFFDPLLPLALALRRLAVGSVPPPLQSISTMSAVVKKTASGEESQMHKIRITLSSRNVKNLEKVCADLVAKSKEKGVQPKGPVRMPTKSLVITCRKSPCGEGFKTWDRFEMTIHKRVIDIVSPTEVVKQITNINIENGVEGAYFFYIPHYFRLELGFGFWVLFFNLSLFFLLEKKINFLNFLFCLFFHQSRSPSPTARRSKSLHF